LKIHRFIGNTAREALARVRETLGPDAMILSNRSVEDEVEILACGEGDFAAIIEEGALTANPITETEAEALVRPAAADQPGLQDLMSEIRTMRDALETQLAELAWTGQQQRHPGRSGALKELLAIGFSPSLARYLSENAPADQSTEQGLAWAQATLARNLQVLPDENELLDKGGIYALVGPTGVGKTTTTAKLAARCVMRHGPGKLALITTDGYRIGAHEQLRIYGKILGVMVHSVKDEVDLRIALDELKNKHTVLIDTVGMSQRDQMVAEQIAMLSDTPVPVKRLLCLNTTSTIDTLNEVVQAYRGSGLAGCILTKLDEAVSISGAIDVVLRQKLRLYYVGTGQRVPEDLQVPRANELMTRAFQGSSSARSARYQDNEMAIVTSPNHIRNDPSVRGIHVA
jgi:flagellar biosynthesis protein FlhF